MKTLYATWVQLFGYPFHEVDSPRLTELLDRLLEPYGAALLGNGDIIGPVNRAGDFIRDVGERYEDTPFREAIRFIDL